MTDEITQESTPSAQEAPSPAQENVLRETLAEAPQAPADPRIPRAGIDYDRLPSVALSPTLAAAKEREVTESPEATEAADWFYADGIPGKGEKPDFFNDKTFKNLSEQARAQNEARKTLGGFTGAPSDGYELNVDESLSTLGFNEEDPLINEFADFAQETNMSQEVFDKIINIYGDSAKQMLEVSESQERLKHEEEIKKLGENGPEEIKLLKQWARNNIPEERQERFLSKITEADDVKMFLELMDKTIPTRITHVPHVEAYTKADLREMYKDARYIHDDDYTAKIKKIEEQVYARR